MRRSILAALLLLPMVGTGCYTVQYGYDGDKLLTNGPGLDRPTRVVRHFEAHDRQFFWIHGGIPTGEPLNAFELAAKEAGDHPGVVNLQVKDGQNIADLFYTHVPCLLGIVCGTWSTWAEGDVVEYTDGGSR